MKLDSRKVRFCKSISCEDLQGIECKAKQCKHSDIAKALEERLGEVKNGRNA